MEFLCKGEKKARLQEVRNMGVEGGVKGEVE